VRLHVEALEDRQCPTTVTVYASGLYNPRGLTFGPDGDLYVAEGGSGGSNSTVGQCDQVPAPVGPYTGGFTSRISKIAPDGTLTTVADKLPSSQTSTMSGSLVSGVSDVKFIGSTLYGMEAGAGCSHGLMGTDNTIFVVNADGTTTTVADLSAFVKANPVANPEPSVPPGDFEPDGTWWSMVAVRGALYATEPNHQELDKIMPDGTISRVIDMSVQFPGTIPPNDWVGPTGIAYHGNFYVGTLGQFPVTPGNESIYKITPSGQLGTAASGLTAVLGVAFDNQGQMYALETDTVAGFPGPGAAGSGMVVRVNDDGSLSTVVSGLVFPTAMTFGPDGALYISNFGFGAPPIGLGQILRVDLGTDAGQDTAAPLAATAATASGRSADLFQAARTLEGTDAVTTPIVSPRTSPATRGSDVLPAASTISVVAAQVADAVFAAGRATAPNDTAGLFAPLDSTNWDAM
jgi:hypothetical protein